MKISLLFREMKHLISEHKLYFMAPILISLILFAILFFKVGPGIIMTFIYAGI
ncbi:hypothetical protein BH10BDE1_BH10BDE1_21960 [soil metagenome]